jgi:hypothetical protein
MGASLMVIERPAAAARLALMGLTRIAEAKEGGAFLHEFLAAGFKEGTILRSIKSSAHLIRQFHPIKA